MARGERRTWAFICLWGLAAASIVVETTSPAPGSTLDVLVQSAGLGYDVSVLTLQRFSAQADLPWFAMEIVYAAVGVIVWIVASFVFERYGFPHSSTAALPILFTVAIVVGIGAVVFAHTAQFIALGLLAVVISGIAALVP